MLRSLASSRLPFGLPDLAPMFAAGTLVLVLWVMLFPRATPVALLLWAGVAVATSHARGGAPLRWAAPGPVALAAAAFIGWCGLSSVWSPLPWHTLGKVLLVALLGLAAGAAATAGRREPLAGKAAVLSGLTLAMAIAGCLLAFEAATDQAIARRVFAAFPSLQEGYGKHLRLDGDTVVDITETNVNRRVLVWSLFLLPALCWLTRQQRSAGDRLRLWIIAAAAMVLLVTTKHQSSQLFMVTAALVGGIRAFSRSWSRRAVQIGFVAIVLLAPSVALVAYKGGLHRAEWLFQSARQRLVIWGYTSELIAESWRGRGADSTAALNRARPKQSVEHPVDHVRQRSTARHAHNVWLQTWYEVGVPGAGLMLLLGLATINQMRAFSPAGEGFALAQLAGVAASLATSYSMWQPWIPGLLGLSALLLCLAIWAREDTTGAGRE